MKLFNTYCKYLIFFFWLSSNVLAVEWDTKGTDFWLTFLPNYHMNKSSNDENFKLSDSLFIFISSDVLTSGRIEYVDLNGNLKFKDFTITDPSGFYIFKVCYLDYELLGFNDSGILGSRNNSEIIKKQYFHISSDDEITVYALNQAYKTSDACIVLPTDILGKDYYILSYNSDGEAVPNLSKLKGGSTPSQFVILALEDNSNVTIIPSTDTKYNGRNTQQIKLNRGDSYLVQALIEVDNSQFNNDLTGTEIHSDKPVAVFAGQQRANVPVMHEGDASRDCLYEEMPPINTWGKNALLVPYVQPANITKRGTDIFRILSAFNSNAIYINGINVATLDKGEFYEGVLDRPALMSTSFPVLVAQFKKTSDYGSGTLMGDPFEMLIPPVEQFLTSYRVLNIQAYDYKGEWFRQLVYTIVYNEQYITIVTPDSSISSLRLDGSPVPSNQFTSIPSSNYSFANIEVNDGVHTVSSKDKIGVYVYGYGQANSYGYVGGMGLRTLDLQAPLITSKDSCTTINGAVFDTLITDTKLKEVISPAKSQINVKVDIEKFVPYRGIVKFKASLIDNFKDGEFEIEATDSFGLISKQKFIIRGFTIAFPDLIFNNLKIGFDSTLLGNCNCDSIHIKNTGILPVNLDQNMFMKRNTVFSIPALQLPFIIQPGESKMLKICYCPVELNNKKQIDTLQMEFNCIKVFLPLTGKVYPFNTIENSDLEKNSKGCIIPLKITILELPENDYLSQTFPNPVTENNTELNFGLSEKGNVVIRIFNIFGNETKTLISDLLDKGVYRINLDCKDFSQGVYLITMHTEKSFLSRKMIIRN